MGYAECKNGKYCGHDCCVPSLCNEFEPVEETEVITLADLIRAMSDEELAKWYASSVVVSSAMMLSHLFTGRRIRMATA